MKFLVQVTETIEREVLVDAANAESAQALLDRWIEDDAHKVVSELGDWRTQAVSKQVHDWWIEDAWEAPDAQ